MSSVAPIVIPPPPLRLYPGPAVTWPIAGLFAALAAWGFATGRGRLSPGFYWFVAICAGLIFIMAVMTTIRRLQLRLTMSLNDLGVTLNERSLSFRDLDALTIAESARHDDRFNVVALNRSITLHAGGKRARASYVAVANDPLDGLLGQLVARMVKERRNRTGEGWSIEHETLVVREQRIPLGMISAAGIFDREVRVWQRGGSEPVLAVPLSSRNAYLLLQIAGDTTARRAESPSAQKETGTDRHLFTRRTSKVAVILQTAVLGGVIALAQYAVTVKVVAFAELAAIGAYAAGALAIFGAIYRITRSYRFHERTVTQTTLFGSRTLSYDDVASITWKEVSTFLEHALYVGTKMKVTLAPAGGAKPFVVHIHRFRTADDDLAPLRRAMSERIAAQWQQQMHHRKRIFWTRNAAFTPMGLEVKTGLLGTGREVLPYGRPINSFVKDGYLILYREQWTNPLTTLETSQPDFYPGLALFEKLMR